MEDKKTLWIIIGIGVCVIVVVAVGFFWFLPTDQSLASAGGNSGPAQAGSAGFDPVEWVRQDESFPGIEETTQATEDFVVIADELVYGIPETTEITNEAEESNVLEQNVETITLDLQQKAEDKEVPALAVKPAAPVRAAVVEKPAVSEASKVVNSTEYWIQAGSFSTVAKARDVKLKLTQHGANSTISTTNVSGTNYFRVRLGPYGDQNEADKFLNWIKAVDGFENSYISEVYVTK